MQVKAPDSWRCDNLRVNEEERVHGEQEVALGTPEPLRQFGFLDQPRGPGLQPECSSRLGHERP